VTPGLLILIGAVALAFSLLILRAEPGRWDNRAFAVLGLLDAAMALYRGVAGLFGASLLDPEVLLPCALLAPLLAWATIEFAWSFPFSRPMPWRWRAPVLAWTATAIGVMMASRDLREAGVLNLGYFIPVSVVFLALQLRNLRRATGDRLGQRLVLAALTLRWLTANAVYTAYGHLDPEVWHQLLWVESTVMVLASFVLIGLAIMRSNLFTMRSAVGELLLETAFVMTGLLLTAAGVAAAGKAAAYWPRIERPLLMLSAVVPLAVFVIAERLRPRLEAGVDPRRARRREFLDAAAPGLADRDPAAVAATATRVLGELTEGGVARFVPTAALPSELRPVLTTGLRCRCGADELAVAVGAGAELDGALIVTGGVLDRESLHAAQQLAARLADACEHRRLRDRLDEARQLATLGAFAAAIAHDIRTPLTSIQMNVQILRGKVDLPPDDMEHFDLAQTELRRLDQHVRELLDYAKPLQLHREPVELAALADDAARTAAAVFHERALTLTRDHAPDLPPVDLDPARLRQVVWNLLDNAAKASPVGAAVELRTRRDGARVAIDVIDRGHGIAAADLPRIFEPFFTTRPDGTGLGLAIGQKIVRGHGGELVVRSQPGEGSTFSIVLPLAA